MRMALACVLLAASAATARAQAPSGAPSAARSDSPAADASADDRHAGGRWIAQFSLLNTFDGNINHDPAPVRSYGFVPGASIDYESSAEPGFAAGYEIAANSFTGTNEWDRISHGLHAAVNGRAGQRWRFEGTGEATWKGSSEDRELSNEYSVSGRAAYRILSSTRLIAIGMLRYKDYPGDSETSGPAPYISGKIDQRFPRGRRLVFGYKYEERHSHLERNRYRRNAYSVEFSTPFLARDARLTLGTVLKDQTYRRLIKVGKVRELRHDLRSSIEALYEYPLSPRVAVAWQAGLERRASNDADKRFFAPTFGMNLGYRWR